MFFNIKERRTVLNKPVQLTVDVFDFNQFSIKYKSNQPGLPNRIPPALRPFLERGHEKQMSDYSKRQKRGYNGSLEAYMNEFLFSTIHQPEWLQDLELKLNEHIKEEMTELATYAINEFFTTGEHKEHVTTREFYADCKMEYTFNIPIHWYSNVATKEGYFGVASSNNEGIPMGYCFLKFDIDRFE